MRTISAALFILCALLGVSNADARVKNGFNVDDALVPPKEIVKGGPGKGDIPALTDPEVVAAADSNFMRPDDRVLGIALDGKARAYPANILNYHEIVNDVLADRSVIVTWCPLCGSGMAFNASFRGVRLVFGVSGLLYNSDVLMYDLNTESLWSQLMSQSISGQLKGAVLESLPLSHTTWRDWLARHPDTDVLDKETGYIRNYRIDPYAGYSGSGKLYFPVAESSDLYRRKEVVLGIEIHGKFRAYPFIELSNGPATFSDEFQGTEFEVQFDEENETAIIFGVDGQELPTVLTYWFAWYAFHPDADIYTLGDGARAPSP